MRAFVINRVSKISPGAKKYIDIAKVTNYMMTDLQKITFYILVRPSLYYSPISFIIFFIIIAFELKLVTLVLPVLIGAGFFL